MDKEKLLAENEILCEGYIKLLNDKEVMLEWGKPQLEALYLTKIGHLQIEKLKGQLSVKTLKRKIEQVHRALNNNQRPNFTVIEITIAAELAKAEEKIMQQTGRLNQAKILLTHLKSPERSADLRKTFRGMAKKLHPDVNPELTDEQLRLWYKIKDAYDTGDLERLKALQVAYEDQINKAADKRLLSKEELLLQNTTLKEGIRLLEEAIDELKKQFPFTIRDKINDESWVQEQREALEKEIAALKTYEEELRAEYEKLVAENG